MSAKGGITEGKSHAEGGIPMVVKSTGQQVELEGGEGVINKRNMASKKTFEFEGKEKTICEIASEINSADGNGVQIDCDNVTGTKYKYAKGGKILNEEEEESFKEWMEDGNVHKFEDGYSTQDAQWRNRLKGMDELRKYFRKEFLSDSYEGGGGIGNVYIALSKTKNGLLLSERFDKQITHKQLFDYYKKKGYEIIDSNIFKVTNKGVLDVFKDAISKFIKEKYNELVDWQNTLLSYEIVGERIIAKSCFVQTKNGNEYKITPNDLVNKKFAKGGWLLINADTERIIKEYDTESEAREMMYEYDGDSFVMEKSELEKEKLRETYRPPAPLNPATYIMKRGGSIDVEKYNFNELRGKYVNLYSMGVELPTENQIVDITLTSPQFRYRDLTLKFDLGNAKIKFDDIEDFLNEEIVYVKTDKEEFGVQLIPNQFAKGGRTKNAMKTDDYENASLSMDSYEDGAIASNPTEFAEGGEIDLPKADKMFHLPLELAVYVPSTQDVDKVISDSELKERVDEVSEYLARLFGGFTKSDKIGGFMSSKSELVTEDVVPVVSFATQSDFNANKDKLVNKLSEWAKKWGQEAIGFEFEGDLYYVPEKFENGGGVGDNYYRISISENDKYIGEYPHSIENLIDAKTIFVQLANQYKRPQYLINVSRRPTSSSGYEKINVNEWYDYVEGFSKGGDVRDFGWYQDFKKQELKRGTEHEMEHIDTIKDFKKEGVSDKDVAKAIAQDHLDENENYYIELEKMEKSSKKVNETLKDFQKHRTYRKNAPKFRLGGNVRENREKIHLMFTEDYSGVIRTKEGKYFSESFFPKDVVYTFSYLLNDGNSTSLELGNTGIYMIVPNKIINVVGFDESKFGNGGSIQPYQSFAELDDNDKSILKMLLKIDPYTATMEQNEKISSFKGTNVVNELSSSMIQKIYSILFKYHNVEHRITNLYLSNIGVGNILMYAPTYLEKTIISYDDKNKYSEIEKEISSIVTLGKKADLLQSDTQLKDIDAIIHVYSESNPKEDALVALFSKTSKAGVALGVCEFTSREKLNKFQQTIGENQGGMAQNQMMMFKKSNDYLIINEGITEEAEYTLIYVMNKF